MKDLIRKSILLGLGGYQYMKDGVEDLVKKLEDEGELTPEEGKKFIDTVLQQGKEIKEKQDKKVKDTLKKAIDELELVTKKDLESLKKELKKE